MHLRFLPGVCVTAAGRISLGGLFLVLQNICAQTAEADQSDSRPRAPLSKHERFDRRLEVVLGRRKHQLIEGAPGHTEVRIQFASLGQADRFWFDASRDYSRRDLNRGGGRLVEFDLPVSAHANTVNTGGFTRSCASDLRRLAVVTSISGQADKACLENPENRKPHSARAFPISLCCYE